VNPYRGDSEDPQRDPALQGEWPAWVAHFVCDGEGVIRAWSLAAERVLGVAIAEAVGKSLNQLFPSDSPDSEPSAPVATGEFSPVRAWTSRDGAGVARTLLRTILELPGEPEVRLLLHLVWPAVRAAAESAARIAGGVDPASAIATRVAHDFYSLLAPVLGNALLLEEENASGEHLLQRLQAIRESTEAARSFAQRLMAIDPRRKFALESADVGQVVRACLPAVRAALREEIVIEDCLDAVVDVVRLNRKQIEQALLHLALNAQDAMPAGGKLAVSVDMIDGADGGLPAGRWVRLRVRDNGRGMEPLLLEHAFEPFVSTKVPGCGIGLGLAAVSAIVGQHGGIIDVESHPGKGSTFSIYLPSVGLPGAEPGGAPSTSTRVADPRRAPAHHQASLLLVEDNAMVRRAVENTLRGMGYRVLAVESGQRCIEVVQDRSRSLDLLITDVVMPEMSGKKLVERVHAIRPGLAVLFMSGYDRLTLASRKLPVATEHFLQKPFDSEDLAQAVRKAIGAEGTSPAREET
jgi:two-component system, cell cycle sensor histidine kinase and response regulator CckA